MKIRKVLFCLSAIALTLYTVWETVRLLPFFSEWYRNHIWGNPLRVELFRLPYTWLFLGGVLTALIASLVRVNEEEAITKAYRNCTYTLSVLSLFITGCAVLHVVQVYGVGFLYVPAGLRIAIDIVGCAWLWMLVFRPSNLKLPKSLRLLIGLGIGLIGLMWALQLSSGIAYLTTGHILMLRTHAFGNWLRFLVPTILLCSYSLFLLNKPNGTMTFRMRTRCERDANESQSEIP